ncbi:Signal transduction histidine kinase [Epilithonimonas hungarica]|uniref:histidine kinase n=2 Tax=Epilithonimonas hungarica TaxID=454006 RepID=A0A1G7J8P4_9FLAO|nr:Signal transduction histidine kinase [Epilithonimonas hungarica]
MENEINLRIKPHICMAFWNWHKMNRIRTYRKQKNKRCFIFFQIITFLLVIFVVSCHSSDKDEQDLSGSFKDQFEEIHKLVYEDPSLARQKSNKILQSISLQDEKSKIICLKYIGSSYAFETNYSEAIKYYKQSLDLADKINFYYEIANLNNNLGTIYNELGNYRSAYIYFIKALENYDLAGNQQKKTGTLNNIGLTYLNLNNQEKALGYFHKALHSSNSNKDTILASTILNNIAICNFSKKQMKLGLENLNRSIYLSEKTKNIYGTCVSYQILGNMFLTENKLDEAYETYSKSINIAKKANLIHLLAVSEIGISRVLLGQNRVEEALRYANDVMRVSIDKKSQSLKTDAYQLLSSIYEKKGDFQGSLKEYQNYVTAKEELNNNTVVNQIYDVEVDYLNQLNKMQQLELEKKELAISNKNIWLFFLSIMFLMIFGGLYLLYRNHQNKQEVKLQKTIIELTKKKSNAALEAEIQERKRIGRELHDSLGYLLSLAGLNASVLQKRKDISDEKKNELLNSLMESINDAFDEVRSISHNLAPSLLSEQGLKGALKNISDRVNQSNKLKMSFDTFGLNHKLDDLMENVLYRTLQEIVNNTIKHAEASELFIQIAKDNNQITLMAEDNGKGFDIESLKDKSSFGLSHIRSWIENLNGTIHIDSKLNRGTIISILIPIE